MLKKRSDKIDDLIKEIESYTKKIDEDQGRSVGLITLYGIKASIAGGKLQRLLNKEARAISDKNAEWNLKLTYAVIFVAVVAIVIGILDSVSDDRRQAKRLEKLEEIRSVEVFQVRLLEEIKVQLKPPQTQTDAQLE